MEPHRGWISAYRPTGHNKRKRTKNQQKGHKGREDRQVVDVGPWNSIFVSSVIFCENHFLAFFGPSVPFGAYF
jgi:hypothetical protein